MLFSSIQKSKKTLLYSYYTEITSLCHAKSVAIKKYFWYAFDKYECQVKGIEIAYMPLGCIRACYLRK